MNISYHDFLKEIMDNYVELTNELALLYYGTSLQHEKIHRLMKKLKPFEVRNYNEKRNDYPKSLICLNIHFFDFNEQMGNSIYNPYLDYLLTKEQLEAVETQLNDFHGYHERIHPKKAWGHCNIVLNNKEYSTRTYTTLDNRRLYFIDDEGLHNHEIRSKIYYLPETLKFKEFKRYKCQNMTNEQRKKFEEKQVKQWLQQVINYKI